MSGINTNFVEKIKYSSDIVDLVLDYVELKKIGSNYKGLCPFHQENTPSFNVSAEKQLFHCFGCGTGGDIISFLMEIENISFNEAIKVLAERNGIELPDSNNNYNKKRQEEKEVIFKINKLAAKFFNYILLNTKTGNLAISYLKERGFTKEDCKKYFLGYAPDNWQALYNFLRGKGYNADLLIKAGLVSRGKNNNCYDRFRDRIIFPIFNIRNEVIAFGGRIIKQEKSAPKYLNSPDTPVFKKGDNLYGLNWSKDIIRKENQVIIMEGYTDILTAHKNKLQHVIASLGTAFTDKQARLLKRYTSNVYISYDADAAGNKATLRGLDILNEEGLNVKVVCLPENTDPDEYIKEEGVKSFKTLLENALNLVEFKIEENLKEYDLRKVEEKVAFTRNLIKILAMIKDNVKRDIHIQNASQRYNIESETIKKGIRAYLNVNHSKKKDKNYNNRYTKKDNTINKNLNLEVSLLKLYLDNPEKRKKLEKYLKEEFFSGKYKQLIQIYKKYSNLSPVEIIDKVEDEKVKKLILSLTLIDENKYDNSETLLDNFIKSKKRNLFMKLQDYNKIKLENLNELLLSFISLAER
ncbi:DNA primase [Natronospora cellulosivora (SeqCode)]